MKRKKENFQEKKLAPPVVRARRGGLAQDIQDKIFQKMSGSKKIRLASELSSFCLKLYRLNENNRP